MLSLVHAVVPTRHILGTNFYAIGNAVVPMKNNIAPAIACRNVEIHSAAGIPCAGAAPLHVLDDNLRGRHLPHIHRLVWRIKYVRTHIADRPVAVVDPAVPIVRMQPHAAVLLPVWFADRRAATPKIPVNPFRHGNRMGTAKHCVGPVRKTEHFRHISDDTFFQVFFKQRTMRYVVSLVADTHGNTVLRRFRFDEKHFFERMGKRFLDKGGNSTANRHERRKRMMMIGRCNKDGIERFAHFFEHYTIIGIGLRRINRRTPPFLGANFLQFGKCIRIRLAQRRHLASADRACAIEKLASPVAAANDCNADRRTCRQLRRTTATETGTPDIKKRHCASNRRALDQTSTSHRHLNPPLPCNDFSQLSHNQSKQSCTHQA